MMQEPPHKKQALAAVHGERSYTNSKGKQVKVYTFTNACVERKEHVAPPTIVVLPNQPQVPPNQPQVPPKQRQVPLKQPLPAKVFTFRGKSLHKGGAASTWQPPSMIVREMLTVPPEEPLEVPKGPSTREQLPGELELEQPLLSEELTYSEPLLSEEITYSEPLLSEEITYSEPLLSKEATSSAQPPATTISDIKEIVNEAFEKLLAQQNEFLAQQQQATNELVRLCTKLSFSLDELAKQTTRQNISETVVSCPMMDSISELKSFEVKLGNDPDFKRETIMWLKQETTQLSHEDKKIYKAMEKLFSRSLLRQCSWTGGSISGTEKFSFVSCHNTRQMLKQVASGETQTISDDYVASCVKKKLKYSAQNAKKKENPSCQME